MSIPADVAVGLGEVLAKVVLPSIRLLDDVDRPIPCNPLWWLLAPVTVTPLDPASRIPVDSEPSTVVARTVIPPLGQVSIRMPLPADCEAVMWSIVVAEEESSRTPARFGRTTSRLLMTTFCLLLAVTPNDWAPASIWWPSPGLVPPASTYRTFAVVS